MSQEPVNDMANINPDDTTEPIESVRSSEVPQGNQDGASDGLHETAKPKDSKSITFTPAQLVAWADKQEAWGSSPAWSKNPDEAEGYARALRHLRYYVKNPIQEII